MSILKNKNEPSARASCLARKRDVPAMAPLTFISPYATKASSISFLLSFEMYSIINLIASFRDAFTFIDAGSMCDGLGLCRMGIKSLFQIILFIS